MARSKLFVQAPPFDFGKQVSVGIKKIEGGEFSVHLDDGTVVTGRTLVVDVKRSIDRHNNDGDPVYAISTSLAVKAKVPPRLKLAKPVKKKVKK